MGKFPLFFFFFLNPSLSINDTSIMMSEKVLSELHFEDGEWSVCDPGSSAQEVVTPGSSQERPLVTPAPVTRSGGDGTMTIQHQARIDVTDPHFVMLDKTLLGREWPELEPGGWWWQTKFNVGPSPGLLSMSGLGPGLGPRPELDN